MKNLVRFFTGLVLLAGCAENDLPAPEDEYDIHFAGYKYEWVLLGPTFDFAHYWKNGKGKLLSGLGVANSIFLDEGTVYIAGYTGDILNESKAVIWINGTGVVLSDEISGANAVHVSNGVVYVAGWFIRQAQV
ncbi:MAG: hypothetical protein RBS55_12685 [Bacteroidales bacterium]|jgi:hypothetical protein|nr:hypothetical protein [Bacteroidales bacterium]